MKIQKACDFVRLRSHCEWQKIHTALATSNWHNVFLIGVFFFYFEKFQCHSISVISCKILEMRGQFSILNVPEKGKTVRAVSQVSSWFNCPSCSNSTMTMLKRVINEFKFQSESVLLLAYYVFILNTILRFAYAFLINLWVLTV